MKTNVKKIILCGCNGKMGHVIRSCVAGRDDAEIVAGIDLTPDSSAGFPIFQKISDCNVTADVLIDFSHPSLLADILNFASARQLPAVLATTGYSAEQIEQIKAVSQKTAVFFTFNMSLGVNLLVELAKKATAVLGGQFDIEIIEKHHNQKIDAPSGTAIMLADAINEAGENRYQYVYDRHAVVKKRDANEIGIHAVRGGTIVGEHEVIFAGRDEILSLKHTAMSKEIFAVGAVNAAVYLAGQSAGLYNMQNMLAD